MLQSCTWTPKACEIMAFGGLSRDVWQLCYVLLLFYVLLASGFQRTPKLKVAAVARTHRQLRSSNSRLARWMGTNSYLLQACALFHANSEQQLYVLRIYIYIYIQIYVHTMICTINCLLYTQQIGIICIYVYTIYIYMYIYICIYIYIRTYIRTY